jgi:hypothetical protein
MLPVTAIGRGFTYGAGRGGLYDLKDGVYQQTMLLPHRVLRIAATKHRLLTLSQQGNEIFLEIYPMPAGIQTLAPILEESTSVNLDRPDGTQPP